MALKTPQLFCISQACRKVTLLVAVLFVQVTVLPPLAAGQEALPAASFAASGKVYKLEDFEIRGSQRLSPEFLEQHLGLHPGSLLSDEFVKNSQTQMLGMGLFRSAMFAMRRGTKPQYVHLIIEVEEDQNVLTSWALGGTLSAYFNEYSVPAANLSAAPMDYRLSIVGRNLFNELHRGNAMADMDSTGHIRAAQVAYGLPRFASEDVQFDAQVAVVNPYERYLDTLGFGGRGEGLWSQALAGEGELIYGAAMYVNKDPDFSLGDFPEAVAGAKLGFYRETRLRSFVPVSGQMVSLSGLFSPINSAQSVIEAEGAKTWAIYHQTTFTVDAKGLTAGIRYQSLRGEVRADVPLGPPEENGDQAALFIGLRAGRDRGPQTHLFGSDAMLGLRYHSAGFIAELVFRITRAPARFEHFGQAGGLAPLTEGR